MPLSRTAGPSTNAQEDGECGEPGEGLQETKASPGYTLTHACGAGPSLSRDAGEGIYVASDRLSPRRLDPIRRERHAAEANAGGVEDGVGDRRRDRAGRGLAGALRRQLGSVDENDVDRLRRLGDVENGIGQPIDAGDVLGVELHLLPERPAGALDDVALDAATQPVGIDDQAAIMGDHPFAR